MYNISGPRNLRTSYVPCVRSTSAVYVYRCDVSWFYGSMVALNWHQVKYIYPVDYQQTAYNKNIFKQNKIKTKHTIASLQCIVFYNNPKLSEASPSSNLHCLLSTRLTRVENILPSHVHCLSGVLPVWLCLLKPSFHGVGGYWAVKGK